MTSKSQIPRLATAGIHDSTTWVARQLCHQIAICVCAWRVKIISLLVADSLHDGFRRNMFADTDTAAVKFDRTLGSCGFIGDKHLRITIGALHMEDP